MKLKFKKQEYQSRAVKTVVGCFAGQPKDQGIRYRIDPGDIPINLEAVGFKNNEIKIGRSQILENIRGIQQKQHLYQSMDLVETKSAQINLDVEMETGTGKTYCYIKTIFEMNKKYGWSKFIIVVPSIAIREGVYKTLEITAEHFLEEYHKRSDFFIYNSKKLNNLESFSSSSQINIMVINIQAFNAKGKDNRRIYERLDEFQSRRPIDVISANNPILILDEPQKMEGKKTLESLEKFNPLFVLHYSATHKTQHNKIYRLDALDAYNQKLVKKISVRGITQKGLTGTNAYLYLESIETSTNKPPIARMELEIKQKNGIKRVSRKIEKGHNLYEISGRLEQYRGFVVSDIDARIDSIEFTNGDTLQIGEAVGNVNESILRHIQIREALKAHFEKEQLLYSKGIKVLSLFFIDEVAKYRIYSEKGRENGEYAKLFEEEYQRLVDEIKKSSLIDAEYKKYLERISAEETHNGYFSVDKNKKMIDSKEAGRGEERECRDVDAYDLILKDKEKLLSLEEPTRFIFSHSALREGWDNPNVFVICALKRSDNTISRRQEVGRGMRISVNQFGERQDDPQTVHITNILTVVANESYKDFVSGLQQDIVEGLSDRPQKADEDFFKGKILYMEDGEDILIDEGMATNIYHYLVKNDYVDGDKRITTKYHEAKKEDELKLLPESLQPYKEKIFSLIDSVYSDALLPDIEDERKTKINSLNQNFDKKEFQKLWAKINKKAIYGIRFDSHELVKKCVISLNTKLKVSPLQYFIQRGEQKKDLTHEQIQEKQGFVVTETSTKKYNRSIQSEVKYNLIEQIMERVSLSGKTIQNIISQLEKGVFDQFKRNPEDFISQAITLINEEKATAIIEHLSYDLTSETYSTDIFTQNQVRQNLKSAVRLKKHIYDYVATDSRIEENFVRDLDAGREVVVYAKLPRGFAIPTPVGNYNPDWAIAFKEGNIKHIYFVAETKGSMFSMELRKIEAGKIECARRFFDKINEKIDGQKIKYDVINSYTELMKVVGQVND